MPSSSELGEEVEKSDDVVTRSGVAEVTLSAGNRTGIPVLVLMLNIDAIDCSELVMLRVVVLVTVVLSAAVLELLLGELLNNVELGYLLASVTVEPVGSEVDS